MIPMKLNSGPEAFLIEVAGGGDTWLGTETIYEKVGYWRFVIIGSLILIISCISGFSAGIAVWLTGDSLPIAPRCILSLIFSIMFFGIVFGLYRLFLCLFQGAGTRLGVKLRWCSAIMPLVTFCLLGFAASIPILVLAMSPQLGSSDQVTKLVQSFRVQLDDISSSSESIRQPFFVAWSANQKRDVPADLKLPTFACLDEVRLDPLPLGAVDRVFIQRVEFCESVLNNFKRAAEAGDLASTEAYKDWSGDWADASLNPYYLAIFDSLMRELKQLRNPQSSRSLISSFEDIFKVWPELCTIWALFFAYLFNFPTMIALVMNRLPIFYYRREMWRAYLATRWGIYIDSFRVFDKDGNQHYVDIYTSPKKVLDQALVELSKSAVSRE